MAALNIYVSRERAQWLREHLEELAREENRSLSYIIEEALVEFIKRQGHKSPPSDKRRDHRTRASL